MDGKDRLFQWQFVHVDFLEAFGGRQDTSIEIQMSPDFAHLLMEELLRAEVDCVERKLKRFRVDQCSVQAQQGILGVMGFALLWSSTVYTIFYYGENIILRRNIYSPSLSLKEESR